MNTLQSLIQKGESEHLEFKTSFGKEAIETLCAFANTRGGTVLVYKRVHNANHLMDLNEIANEHLRTINLSWDFARDPNHDINDISLEKVNQFIENSNRFRDYPINDDPYSKKQELLKNMVPGSNG